jgi:hypothetical protein
MTDWIDFACYAVFLGVLYFVVGGALSRLGLLAVLDRNAEWLCANPAIRDRLMRGRGFRVVCYALGTLSLVLLTACQFGFWPAALSAPRFEPAHWMVLKDLATALVLPLLIAYTCAAALFGRWLRTVPRPERREATLVPRALGHFVPRRARLAMYGAIAAHFAAWLAAAAWLIYAMPEQWLARASQFGGAAVVFGATHAVFFFLARAAVGRKPGTLDNVIGPSFRRRQVQSIFAFNGLVVATGTLRLLGELRAEGFDYTRVSQLLLVLGVLGLCAIGSWPRRPLGDQGASGAAS